MQRRMRPIFDRARHEIAKILSCKKNGKCLVGIDKAVDIDHSGDNQKQNPSQPYEKI